GDYLNQPGNDMPPGIIGELYINFHVIGVVGGMFLFGRLMVFVHRLLMQSYGGIAFYALLVPYFGVFLSRNLLGGGVLMLATVLPMWPAVRYIESEPVTWHSRLTDWFALAGLEVKAPEDRQY